MAFKVTGLSLPFVTNDFVLKAIFWTNLSGLIILIRIQLVSGLSGTLTHRIWVNHFIVQSIMIVGGDL